MYGIIDVSAYIVKSKAKNGVLTMKKGYPKI